MPAAPAASSLKRRISAWFYEGYSRPVGPHAAQPSHTADWWKVMCLTGVDYFSTLAYQPSIAFLAAGTLSPIATLVLVLLTLFGALPMYNRIADMSPHGQGSIVILEQLFSRWKGKLVVLALLGFAATDFVITITLSAADATAHLLENPLVPRWLDYPIPVTLALLVALGLIFLRGFKEAITLAVVLVGLYLALNVVVLVTAFREILQDPGLIANWRASLFEAARQSADDGRRGDRPLSEAGARLVGVRNGCRRDAAREGRSRATPKTSLSAVSATRRNFLRRPRSS